MAVELDHCTDEQLAEKAARESSDGPAFLALVKRFRPRVWRICFRLLDNETDAADAAQEVFLRLFLHRSRFAGRSKICHLGACDRREDLSGDAAKPWTAAATRKRRRGSPVGMRDNRPAPLLRKAWAWTCMKMLETLDEEDRALLLLKYAEAYDYEELAAIFEISVSACKMRISRARDKLQSRFPQS